MTTLVRARWQPAGRAALIVGAPLAAGFSTGARGLGMCAALAAFAVLLLGAPGYGIARRTSVVGLSLVTGFFCSVGGLLGSATWVVTGLLILLALLFAGGRWMDRGAAIVTFVPMAAVLTGSGLTRGWLAAGEHLIAALVGGCFVLLIDRVWPSPEHPSVDLTGGARGRDLVAILGAPLVYLVASLLSLEAAGALAFVVLAVKVVWTQRGDDQRGDLIGLGFVSATAAILIIAPVRADVSVLVVVAVVLWGATRARLGTLPLWSVLGVAVLLASMNG